jgi:eukaryotic-like serine/threonine-protein kinase
MRSIQRLIREIHRRSLWQVLGIYLVGSWFGYQVILALTDGLGLPTWVPPFAVVLFIIGLPVVIATAFVQEGAPARNDFRRGPRATGQPDSVFEPNPVDAGAAAAHDAPTPEPRRTPDPPGKDLHSVLTWPRALAGGLIAFLLLAAGTTGWVGMRALGIGPVGSLVAAGALDASEPILIADFQAPARDSVIAAVVSEAFRIDFARSTLIRTVEPMAVRAGLARMGRDDATSLTADLAQELAVRDGIPAYLVGDVTGVGGGYVLSTRLIATSSGETIVALRETARDSADLVPAIDRLSRALRERTGESLRTIRREPPLEQVTTPSLEALRIFTEARRMQVWQNDQASALGMFQQAVERDSTFASAWRSIAAIHSNYDRNDEALDAISRALRFQDRLTAAERDIATAQEAFTRRDYRRAVEAYERALARHPHNGTALNNLAWAYYVMDDVARAERYYRVALDAEPGHTIARSSLGTLLWRAGRFDEARHELETALELEPGAVGATIFLAALPGGYEDHASAERNIRRLLEEPSTPARLREVASQRLYFTLLTGGRLAEAADVLAQFTGALHDPEVADRVRLATRFWAELEILDDRSRAGATLDQLVRLAEGQSDPDRADLLGLAEMCFALGDDSCARRYLDRAGLDGPSAPWAPRRDYRLLGDRALADGDADEAVRLFRAAGGTCTNCFELDVARAFIAAGQPDSAAAAYERAIATPSYPRLWTVDWRLVPIHERLADYYEGRGDARRSAAHHARVIELWERADPALQPRVERARRALARLSGET